MTPAPNEVSKDANFRQKIERHIQELERIEKEVPQLIRNIKKVVGICHRGLKDGLLKPAGFLFENEKGVIYIQPIFGYEPEKGLCRNDERCLLTAGGEQFSVLKYVRTNRNDVAVVWGKGGDETIYALQGYTQGSNGEAAAKQAISKNEGGRYAVILSQHTGSDSIVPEAWQEATYLNHDLLTKLLRGLENACGATEESLRQKTTTEGGPDYLR